MTPRVRVVLGHGHIGYSVKIYSNYLATPFSATGHIFWSKEDFLGYAFSFYGHIGPILGLLRLGFEHPTFRFNRLYCKIHDPQSKGCARA